MTDVLYELSGGVATITLNRPERLNAMNKVGMQRLFSIWEAFEKDDNARVAILTGVGERAFSVGRDLKEREESLFDLRSIPLIGATVKVSKPTIAAVNGMALGGGFLFAQMCDICLASEHATFSIPEAKLGRGAAWAAPLTNLLPARVVMEMLLTGAPMAAQRLHALGFIGAVVAPAELMSTAKKMAALIAANAPLSVAACRRMVRTAYTHGLALKPSEAEALFAQVYESEDAAEGARAFNEKRQPVWKGR